jgi:zinc and cadmium transporter
MVVAWLITTLALFGVFFGALGQARMPSAQLAAAGGGLLTGICIFWLMPEISSTLGMWRAIGFPVAVCVALLLIDRVLGDAEHPDRHHRFVAPLLAATALHSFLDGWSVRTLSVREFANVAVPIGIALHKIPEGLALGWLARRTMDRTRAAIATASAVELMTPVGAFVEPYADQSGLAAFGPSWTALVLGTVGGSFLFLGFHAIVPERRKVAVLAIFFCIFGAVGLLAFLHERA